MSAPSTSTSTSALTGERADLLAALAQHRFLLRHTTRDLTDENARQRTTVSALCLGGIIKHVTQCEESWTRFMLGQPGGPTGLSEEAIARHEEGFRMQDDETLAALLERYAEVAKATDEAVAALPDLDVSHPLPPAPWFEPGARWSARRVLVHILAETAQHSGHADIIREALDGAKSMG